MSNVIDKTAESLPEPDGTHRFMPDLSSVLTLFGFDLLVVATVFGAMLGGLSFLRTSVTVGTETMEPWKLLTGNAILLVVAATILATVISTAFSHVRYMVFDQGDYRFQGFVGLILAVGILAATGCTLYYFYTDPGKFLDRAIEHLGAQAILAVVTLYYAAMLKRELVCSLYRHTIDSGIARLQQLEAQSGLSSRVERENLRRFQKDRHAELNEFNRQFERHVRGLRD